MHSNSVNFHQAALLDHLVADGWKEYPDQFRKYSRCFFKRFETPTRCACNSEKLGIQICVAVFSSGYEMDLCGELPDGTWVKLHQWAMPEDYLTGLALIPRLLATWEAMASWQNDINL